MFPTLAVSSAGLFIVLLAILHVVRADLDPSWHMISEYGVGTSGWMMTAAFLALAGAFFTLMLSLRPVASGWLGVLGLVLLVMASASLVMGGLFPTDPPATPHDQISRNGMLHGVSFMFGVPSTLLGVALVSARLWRETSWHSARAMLLSTAGLVWLTMVVFAVSMVTYLGRGAIGPQFLVGWQNRAAVLAWAVWVIALSWQRMTTVDSR